MSSEFKLSDQTSVALPIKNIVAIVSAIVVAVWTYFGIVERLNRLEIKTKRHSIKCKIYHIFQIIYGILYFNMTK